MKNNRYIKLFLRLALASSFLSAVADRFGAWPENVSAWGNWQSFVAYTAILNPWSPDPMVPWLAMAATLAETLLACCLLIGFKTEWAARISGVLLLIFALSMTFSTGIKGPLDYSVFVASSAGFALSVMKGKFLEIDQWLQN